MNIRLKKHVNSSSNDFLNRSLEIATAYPTFFLVSEKALTTESGFTSFSTEKDFVDYKKDIFTKRICKQFLENCRHSSPTEADKFEARVKIEILNFLDLLERYLFMKHFTNLSKPEAETESINALLKQIRTGKIIIPIFQRHFVWEKKDISFLFDSIYHGYPIGNFLFWKIKLDTPDNKVKIGPLKFAREEVGEVDAVVDGQQRLTSLAGVLLLKHATILKEEQIHFIKHSWLPFSAGLKFGNLTNEIENILSQIGSEFQIIFAS